MLPQVHLISDPSTSPPIYAEENINHIWQLSSGSQSYHLLRRGWIYQERLLSLRVVHFTEDELSWECYELSTCQCRETVPENTNKETPKLKHAMALGLVDRTKTTDELATRQRWRDMVCDYSKLDLTVVSDRLPALQGCAEQVQGLLKDSYSSGLWERGSEQDLSWYSWTKRPGARDPPLFQVPTWSWASVSGGVWYFDYDHLSAEAHVELVQAQDDLHRHQKPAYWLVTGSMIPARLKLANDYTIDSATDIDDPKNGNEVHINHDLLVAGAKTTLLPTSVYVFHQDFQLRASSWDTESWYDINLLCLQRDGDNGHDICLVLWRYGRGIPSSGLDRERSDGHEIHQRIGLLDAATWRVTLSMWKDTPPPLIDWNSAQRVTIALE